MSCSLLSEKETEGVLGEKAAQEQALCQQCGQHPTQGVGSSSHFLDSCSAFQNSPLAFYFPSKDDELTSIHGAQRKHSQLERENQAATKQECSVIRTRGP